MPKKLPISGDFGLKRPVIQKPFKRKSALSIEARIVKDTAPGHSVKDIHQNIRNRL